MRILVTLLAAVGVCTSAAATARAANPPPLFVFHGPTPASRHGIAARNGLNGLADRRGSALIDISDQAQPPPRAAENLSRAIEAYREFRYDQALKLLEAGVADASATGARGLSTAELSDLFVYRALVHTQRGDAARAWDSFLAAAAIEPNRKLDPVRFSPRVIETFDRAVDSVIAAKLVELTIEAPAACDLVVDARSISRGALSVSLPRGEHYLRADCPGYYVYGGHFTASPGITNTRPALRLRKVPTRTRAIAEARSRGADTVIWSRVMGTTAPSMTVELIDANTGKERARIFTRLTGSDALATLIRRVEALVDDVVQPAVPVVIVEPRSWYQKPWVWGVTGATIAAGVLLPFILEASPARGFKTRVPYPQVRP